MPAVTATLTLIRSRRHRDASTPRPCFPAVSRVEERGRPPRLCAEAACPVQRRGEMHEMHDTLITKEGHEKLQAELAQLRTTGRATIAERIRAAAAAEANAVESVDYRDAREDQELLER